MNFLDLFWLLLHTVISILSAGLFSLYLNRWADHHFKYPLFREVVITDSATSSDKKRSTKLELSFRAALIVFIFYALVGFMIALGIIDPITPENITGIHLNAVELTIIGLTMVGLVRFVTLNSSVDAHRILVDGLTLASGLGSFIVLHFPDEFNRIVKNSSVLFYGKYPVFFQTLFIFAFIIIIGGLVETIWFLRVNVRKGFLMPESFVESLQGVNSYLEIGYLQRNVLAALQRIIQKTILTEGVWEICYLGAFGDNVDLLKNIALYNAKWLAQNDNIDFDMLDDDKQQLFLDQSKNVIKKAGMFLLPNNARSGFESFHSILNFLPGKISKTPEVRYLILNRKVVVEVWNAHSNQALYEPPNKVYASTMYSISDDPSRITRRLKEFQSAWGNYVMNNTFSVLSNIGSENCLALLSIIIDRSGSWSKEELLAEAIARKTKNLSTSTIINKALKGLIDDNQIIVESNGYYRDPKLFIWQERWLRAKSKRHY